MAHLILFHHALGLTAGVEAFAQALRTEGHEVTVPDLYDGVTFATIGEGVGHAEEVGFKNLIAAATTVAEMHPEHVVYGGFSLGGLLAHKLAQTRPEAQGALLYHYGDVPIDTFGDKWPAGTPVQFHIGEHDEWCERDVVDDFVRRAGASAPAAELFLYPGSTHLFTEATLAGYDATATAQVLRRTVEFLNRI